VGVILPMVHHKLKVVHGRRYNYLDHNVRIGNKFHTISKYIGRGKISKGRIQEEIENHRPYFQKRIEQIKIYSRKIKYLPLFLNGFLT